MMGENTKVRRRKKIKILQYNCGFVFPAQVSDCIFSHEKAFVAVNGEKQVKLSSTD